MPLLQVRDMPEDLYEKLADTAEQDNRSIAQETVALLKKALGYKENRVARRRRVLEEIANNLLTGSDNFPDPADLIREDRDR
ncbi:MAG TPA: Arc family DNA-binding protein [Rectinema sp.]|jgi:plasmid stability protein|nr:Arc family DNA-binding protein [Rectinema sp.]